jgi:hypothetical protein
LKEGRKYVLGFKSSLHDVRPLFVWVSLALAVVGALGVLLSVSPAARAQEELEAQVTVECDPDPTQEPQVQVPGAEKQDADCLADLTTRTLKLDPDHTNTTDWDEPIPLHAKETVNPAGADPIPGLQVDGYFPDGSDSTNCNNLEDFGECHDSQFVIRFPDKWNGKLVITGAPGTRRQYALDFIISDFVLSKGYAFASIDKGNTGDRFYEDGEQPGDAVAEWHHRVKQLTEATQTAVNRWYGQDPEYTYMTGISNGGYLTRYAIENNPELYDGAVDWEGVLWRRNEPNLFTHLPQGLRHFHECQESAPDFDNHACDLMYKAGYKRGSEFLWDQHYAQYWDITQRLFREEFDPGWDNKPGPGTPLCQEEGPSPGTRCDAEYQYKKRPDKVKDRVERISLTGDIGKPMITLHGTLDSLLPIRRHSDPYRELIKNKGKGNMHRYYVIEDGNHVDSFYDVYPREGETALRPILPCYWAAFEELEEWVEQKPGANDKQPPDNTTVPNKRSGDEANHCRINGEATYSPPATTPTP